MYLVNRKQGYLYASIPKAACSSLKSWHLRVLGQQSLLAQEPLHAYCNTSANVGRLTGEAARLALQDDSLLKFAFVRNPFSRLVSAYLDKVVRVAGPGRWVAKRMVRGAWWNVAARGKYILGKARYGEEVALAASATFRQFAKLVTSLQPNTLDIHWRPQTLQVETPRLDFIGQLETFSDDFARLQTKLGLKIEEPQRNRRGPKTKPGIESCLADTPAPVLRDRPAPPRWESFYDAALVERVSEFYADDFAAFGYKRAIDGGQARRVA